MASTRRKVRSQAERRLAELQAALLCAESEIESRKRLISELDRKVFEIRSRTNELHGKVERLNAERETAESELSSKRKQMSILMQQVKPKDPVARNASMEESLFCSAFHLPEISICTPLDLINEFIFGFGSKRITLIILNTRTLHSLFHSGTRMLTYSGIPVVGDYSIPETRVMVVASTF